MFLQFLEKIPDAPAVEIPPLHSPHLGCKHADKTEKKRGKNKANWKIHRVSNNIEILERLTGTRKKNLEMN